MIPFKYKFTEKEKDPNFYEEKLKPELEGILLWAITGTSRVDGKSGTVNLNYHHEENIFTLWRSLRFGDNLQAWLEQNARLPGNDCPQGKECEEKQ